MTRSRTLLFAALVISALSLLLPSIASADVSGRYGAYVTVDDGDSVRGEYQQVYRMRSFYEVYLWGLRAEGTELVGRPTSLMGAGYLSVTTYSGTWVGYMLTSDLEYTDFGGRRGPTG